MKNNSILLILLCLFSITMFSQTVYLGGIVNQYARVDFYDRCKNQVIVNDVNPFAVGDTVLVIQMAGADINNTNTSFYGSVNSYNNSGNFEYAEIGSISGSVITFKNVLTRFYNHEGKMQLVTVPYHTNIEVTALISCPAWNGSTGGVIALKAQNKLSLLANINADGKGFRGADTLSDDCFNGGFGGSSDYRCNLSTLCGALKGEGIYIPDTNNMYGRGPNANGGGGGNDHNSGGGGGSNYGAGGLGGDRINASMFSCPGGNPGIGGRALLYDPTNNKIFLGGGGGAGEGNNHVNTKGANGGGIIILDANEIEANSIQISANGDTVFGVASGDGAGGGGAGGVVLLRASTYTTSSLQINVNGGKGGNVNNGFDPAANRCMGPGGGGGGGAVWYSSATVPSGITVSALGGITGITSWPGAHPSCVFSSNGGRDGEIGGELFNAFIPQSATAYIPHTFSICCDTTICKGQTAIVQSNQSGTPPLSVSWNTGQTSTSISITPPSSLAIIGTGTDVLGCEIKDTVQIQISSLNLGVYAAPADTVYEGSTVRLNAVLPGTETITWIPSTGLSSTTSRNPQFTATDTITYCVYGQTAFGCSDTDCVTIFIIPDSTIEEYIAFPDAFTPNADGKNDLYNVFYTGNADEFTWIIFNRWGQIVNQENTLNNPWNGQFEGKAQEIGTYVYMLETHNSRTHERKKYTGSFLLLR